MCQKSVRICFLISTISNIVHLVPSKLIPWKITKSCNCGYVRLVLFTVSPLSVFINPIFQTSALLQYLSSTNSPNKDDDLYLLQSVSSLPISPCASPADLFDLIHALQFLVRLACILICFLRMPASLAISLFSVR